jgi:multiple sugar transport system permease protein
MGLSDVSWFGSWATAFSANVITNTWLGFPFMMVVALGALETIPKELYEAASVDGASRWQKFRFVTWPSLATLYLTSTILSMIWTLGDFNSVYLLTGGGPADLTHILATLGIRYLRLDQVDLAMATIVVAMPLVLPLVYFMMKRLSR